MNGGFVLILRALLKHPAFRDEGEALQFAWLILNAAWKPTRLRYKDRVIHLKRGQLAVSVRDMATRLGMRPTAIQRFLEKLKNRDMIKTASDTGVTIVTVCNYSKYQDYPTAADTARDTGTDTGPIQGRDTEQQYKQREQDSAGKPLAKRTFLSDDWQAPAISELSPKARECAEQWPPGFYEREAEAFTLYWQSERKMKTDWPKTWANRVINQHWRAMQEGRRESNRAGNGGEKPLWETLRDARGHA